MNILVKAVMAIILVVTLTVWAIIGLIFWIPLLLRATTVFSAMIFHAAITKQNSNTTKNSLEAAASFYFNGFRNAINIMKNEVPNSKAIVELRLPVVILEIIWAGLIWLAIFYLWKQDIIDMQYLY